MTNVTINNVPRIMDALKRVASRNIAAVVLLRRLIRRPQCYISIAHRCHSAARIDQNIVLHQTMRQISTPTTKQFWNTSLLDVQTGVQRNRRKL